MRRLVRNLVIWAVIGAIVNTALALTLTWCQPHVPTQDFWHLRSDGPTGRLWAVSVLQGWGVCGVRSAWRALPASYGAGLGRPEEAKIPECFRSCFRQPDGHVEGDRGLDEWRAAGWPFATFRGGFESVRRADGEHVTLYRVLYRGSTPKPNETFYQGTLIPLGVLWPGLLANTAFYGLILWTLWFTPGAIKRVLRRRRGGCVRCGYDLRGEATTCPECGGGA